MSGPKILDWMDDYFIWQLVSDVMKDMGEEERWQTVHYFENHPKYKEPGVINSLAQMARDTAEGLELTEHPPM